MQTVAQDQPILITGGTGFVGSYLVAALAAAGYTNLHVTALDEAPEKSELMTVHPIDLLDAEAVKYLWERVQPQAVFHLAALTSVGESFAEAEKFISQNTRLQSNVLQATQQVAPSARVITISSAEVYGGVADHYQYIPETAALDPKSPYAQSKVQQEQVAQTAVAAGLDVVIARPANHTGPGQRNQFVVPAFAQQVALVEAGTQEKIWVVNLKAFSVLRVVRDVCGAYIALLQKGIPGEIYNIGSGTGVSIQSVLDLLLNMSQAEVAVAQDPAKMRPSEVSRLVLDTTKMQQLGWQPTHSLQETLQDVLAYWRTQV